MLCYNLPWVLLFQRRHRENPESQTVSFLAWASRIFQRANIFENEIATRVDGLG